MPSRVLTGRALETAAGFPERAARFRNTHRPAPAQPRLEEHTAARRCRRRAVLAIEGDGLGASANRRRKLPTHFTGWNVDQVILHDCSSCEAYQRADSVRDTLARRVAEAAARRSFGLFDYLRRLRAGSAIGGLLHGDDGLRQRGHPVSAILVAVPGTHLQGVLSVGSV